MRTTGYMFVCMGLMMTTIGATLADSPSLKVPVTFIGCGLMMMILGGFLADLKEDDE